MNNREIKFRAWNENTKKMIDLHAVSPLALSDNVIEGTDGLFIPFMDNITLMQYTDLKDKNGKEIYEGDILGYWDEATWQVGWDNEKCKYMAIYYKGEKSADGSVNLGGFGAFGLVKSICSRKKIIGNIYSNPKLLSPNKE